MDIPPRDSIVTLNKQYTLHHISHFDFATFKIYGQSMLRQYDVTCHGMPLLILTGVGRAFYWSERGRKCPVFWFLQPFQGVPRGHECPLENQADIRDLW